MSAFVTTAPRLHAASARRNHAHRLVAPVMSDELNVAGPMISRRALLAGAAAMVAANAASGGISEADATVSFDIDRFGDKELKVAAINSVKQSCRNILSERPDLLPSFFVLCLHDALTFKKDTFEGGPNGSLRFELDRPQNAEVREAVQALSAVREGRRDAMSHADIFAFAGAVAVEVTGGPRVVIQLGREDAKEADPEGPSSLYLPSANAADLSLAFESAALDPRKDVVLIHGGFGSLADIAKTRLAKLSAQGNKFAVAEDDFSSSSSSSSDDSGSSGDDEDGIDDITYGRVRGKKRGPVLVSSNVSELTLGGAKFSNAYLKFLVDARKKNMVDDLSPRDRALLTAPEYYPYIEQYANNNRKFLDDVGALMEKVSLLGSQFESLKFSNS